uniref:Putative secreted protein n=1 Tax=Aedes aegypti TaxID=7159 RepID=Q8T9W0_AEDAE|nr:putative secreted protein [Aedes aegypti]
MSNFFIFVALLVVISPQVLGKSKDYCSSVFRKICENKGEHVGCRPKDFSDYPSCSNQHPKLILMKSSYKKYILKRHNELRNKLASGTMTSTHGTFPSAMNMSELKWDSELEKLAEYNVRQCTMNHDRCRSTDKFHDAGQNIYYSSWSQKRSSDKTNLIGEAIQAWWDEHKDFYIHEVANYRGQSRGVLHFTAMALDYQTRVGCAISEYDYAGTGDTFLMTCNYSSWTWMEKPIYNKGKACSKCKKCDKTYKSLCK